MLILGVVLLLLGLLLGIHLLWIAGIVLVIIGAVLWFAGTERVGRRYY